MSQWICIGNKLRVKLKKYEKFAIQCYADTVDPHTVDIFASPVIHKNSNTVDIFFILKEINPSPFKKAAAAL